LSDDSAPHTKPVDVHTRFAVLHCKVGGKRLEAAGLLDMSSMPPGVHLACHNQAKPVPVVDLSLCCVVCRSWSSMLAVITCSGRCVADGHACCLGLDARLTLENVLWSTTVQQQGCLFANVGLPTSFHCSA
jgi:hypothetical protein